LNLSHAKIFSGNRKLSLNIKSEANNMIESLVSIEGNSVDLETLRGTSLSNAKQIVLGFASQFGIVVHIAATSPTDLSNALIAFAQISGVTRVSTISIKV
jgi:hypothetical protein